MDRLTTGRRRVRSGSVHVTELIRKQPGEFDDGAATDATAPTGAENADAADPAETTEVIETVGVVRAAGVGRAIETTAPLAHRGASRAPARSEQAGFPAAPPVAPAAPSRGAQLAKLAGLGLAVVTLCGAIAAATVITRDRGTDQAGRPDLQITGERALLPHELTRAVAESSAGAGPGPVIAPTSSATGDLERAIAPAKANRTTTPAHRPGDTSPARAGRATAQPVTSSRELVLEYYRLIEVNPRGAFDLIAGDLLGTSLGEFLGSWTSVARIEVLDVLDRPDGVLAVIRMQLLGGSSLRIQQLLTVTESAPRRIVGAILVSAQSD